jgi:copper(I)-binding protein
VGHRALALVAILALAACAPEVPPPGEPTLFATSAWARAAASGAATAMYFTLDNRDTLPDTLSGVRSDAADDVSLHISTQHSGTMHMTPITALPVPARDSVMFRPLGAHVMLVGLHTALAEDDTVRAVLSFVSGDTVVVQAHVRRP